MAKVTASIGSEHYKVMIQSASGNVLIADEHEDNGGKDLGLNPHELLAAALSACTAATLRMYADRKEWSLNSLEVTVDMMEPDETGSTKIQRSLSIEGDLDEIQKQRLMAIANKCPIHKLLTNPIEIETSLKV